MADYGVTPQGFVRKRLADAQGEIETALRLQFGNYINLLPASVFGQIVGIMADREGSIWEVVEDVYNSAYPASASGVSLDNVLSNNGLTRLGATASKVLNQLLFGTAGSVVPAGTLFAVLGSPTSQFQTLTDVTLVAGANEVQLVVFSGVPASGSYALLYNGTATTALAFNANAAAVQAALQAIPGLSGVTVTGNYTAGFTVTFGGSAGTQNQPTLTSTTSSLVTSGAATVIITVSTTTAGVPQGLVNLVATTTGPVTAPTGTLTVIVNPVSGLTSTVNVEDATVGRDVETDDEARVRRAATLQVAGAGTAEAIKSRILALADVTAAIVYQNNSLITDTAGRPSKSYEVVINGGDPSDINPAIFLSKPTGIATFGNQTGTYVDSQGTTQTVYWSRPTVVPIYISLDLTVNSLFPANGAASVAQLILNYGNALGLDGDVVVYPQLISAISSVPGIIGIRTRVDIAAVSTTTGAAAVDANIPIASNQISSWDSSRVNINVVAGS